MIYFQFLVEKGYPSNVSSNLHFMSKQEFLRIFNVSYFNWGVRH